MTGWLSEVMTDRIQNEHSEPAFGLIATKRPCGARRLNSQRASQCIRGSFEVRQTRVDVVGERFRALGFWHLDERRKSQLLGTMECGEKRPERWLIFMRGRTSITVVCFASRQAEPNRQAVGIDHCISLAGQSASRPNPKPACLTRNASRF